MTPEINANQQTAIERLLCTDSLLAWWEMQGIHNTGELLDFRVVTFLPSVPGCDRHNICMDLCACVCDVY